MSRLPVDADTREAAHRSRPVGRRARACLLLALLVPALAFGLARDRDQPMDVEADDGVATLGTADGDAQLRGNVRIDQGTLRIDADQATVQKRGGEIRRVIFDGRPARMRQQLDTGGMTTAQARRVDYDVINETIVLTGDVIITQPEGNMQGERITYNMQTGQMTGGAPGSRIRMRIEPRARPATPD